MSGGVNMAASPYIYSRSLGQAVCCSYPENHRCQVLKIFKKTVEIYKSWPIKSFGLMKFNRRISITYSPLCGSSFLSPRADQCIRQHISHSSCQCNLLYKQYKLVCHLHPIYRCRWNYNKSQEVNSQLINRIVGISYNFCCVWAIYVPKANFFFSHARKFWKVGENIKITNISLYKPVYTYLN